MPRTVQSCLGEREPGAAAACRLVNDPVRHRKLRCRRCVGPSQLHSCHRRAQSFAHQPQKLVIEYLNGWRTQTSSLVSDDAEGVQHGDTHEGDDDQPRRGMPPVAAGRSPCMAWHPFGSSRILPGDVTWFEGVWHSVPIAA